MVVTFGLHLFQSLSLCFIDGEERTYGGCEGPDAMYVKLISSDGHEFIVKREHALTSGTIKAMLSGPGEILYHSHTHIHIRVLICTRIYILYILVCIQMVALSSLCIV